MVNIGIDFGSTSTMVSVYDNVKKKYYFGTQARTKMSNSNSVCFRGFKMLLNCTANEAMLSNRSYTGENTPYHIAKLF